MATVLDQDARKFIVDMIMFMAVILFLAGVVLVAYSIAGAIK